MRLEIRINQYNHMIDSTDPEILGKWMIEIFARTGGLGPADIVQVIAQPSFVADPSASGGYRPDWITDTRIVGGVFQVKTPRELVEALARQLDDAEADHG
jgi:hypothetical protein